jgi:secreted trypsin-like serine protease
VNRLTALAAAVTVMLVTAGSGSAISNGSLDGEGHPSVGAFLVQIEGDWLVLCSGALVAPRVFLTASHCTSFAEARGWPVAVSFDSTDVENTTDIRPGTPVTNPAYKPPYQNDVSLILLDDPVTDRAAMPLAPVGYLDVLKQAQAIDDTVFTNVGYGTQERVKGSKEFPFDGSRWVSTSSFSSLSQERIHLHQKENRDEGGSCYGDSGSPTLVGDTIVAIVSTGDIPCWSTSVNTRVDTQDVHDFLAPFLGLD